MSRLLLVLAVAPAFAVVLAAVVGLSIRWRYPNGRAAVTMLAPVLYAVVVVVAAVGAAWQVGFAPAELGIDVPTSDGLLWTILLAVGWSAGGALLGVLGYLVELALVGRRTRKTARVLTTTEPVGMRAVRSWVTRPAALVGLGVTTAVAEELLFRGYLLGGLLSALEPLAAIALAAGVFALHHSGFGWRAVPAKFSHGLVWGAVTTLAGSLLPAMVAHLVFQLLVCRRLIRGGGTEGEHGGDQGATAQRATAL